jgi:hypothetical protein
MVDQNVVSPILGLQRPEFTEAAYQILRVLKERSLMSPASEEELLDVAGFESSIDPSGNLRPNVEGVLRAIEAAEGKSLQEIPENDLSKYRQVLFDLLSSRAKVGLAGKQISGAELLARVS